MFHYTKPTRLFGLHYRRVGGGVRSTSPILRRLRRKSCCLHSDSVPHAGSITAGTHPYVQQRTSALGPGFVPAVKAALCTNRSTEYPPDWPSSGDSVSRDHQSGAGLGFVAHLVDKSSRTFIGKLLGSTGSWKWRCC